MDTLPREVRNVSQYDLEPFKRGRKVGYYLLGKVVGEGSFAKVREGVHILTGEKVCLRLLFYGFCFNVLVVIIAI